MANLIEDITVSVATTQVDIDLTSTPIEKGELYELVVTSINGSGTSEYTGVYPNDNTTVTNYYVQSLRATGSTTPNGARTNRNEISITNSGETSLSKTYIKLTNDGHFVMLGKDIRDVGSTEIELYNPFTTSTPTFASITKLSIISSQANGIGINSRIQLRKVATKVDEVIVGTATTQIDFIGLDIQKGNEYLLVSDIVNSQASALTSRIFINDNVTTTNYYSQLLLANGTSVTAPARLNAPVISSNSSNDKTLNITKIKIVNSGYVNYQANNVRDYGETDIDIYNMYGSSTFTVTNITKISINGDLSNGIGVNSRFELYKLV